MANTSAVIGATDRFPYSPAPLIGATDQSDIDRAGMRSRTCNSIGATDHSHPPRAKSIGATDRPELEISQPA